MKINTGENANYYASVIPFLLSATLQKKSNPFDGWTGTLVRIITLGASLYILAKCNSRTAIIASSLGSIWVLASCFEVKSALLKFRKRFYLIILLLVVILTCTTIVGIKTYERNSASVQGRFLIYKVTYDMISQRPVWGYGHGSFKQLYNQYQSKYLSTNTNPINERLLAGNSYFAFNEFLEISVELGLVGLCFMLLALLITVNLMITGKLNRLEIGAAGSMLSIIICALFSYPFHTTSVLLNVVFFMAILSNRMPPKFTIKSSRIVTSILFLSCFALSLFFQFTSGEE